MPDYFQPEININYFSHEYRPFSRVKMPYLPPAPVIGFETLPWHILVYISVLVIMYLFFAEMVKRFIYLRVVKG